MKTKRVILCVIATLAMAGCSKITKENYQALTTGMDYSEVEKLLGAPNACQEAIGLKQCTWGNEQRFIDIKFVVDKVTLYSHQGVK